MELKAFITKALADIEESITEPTSVMMSISVKPETENSITVQAGTGHVLNLQLTVKPKAR